MRSHKSFLPANPLGRFSSVSCGGCESTLTSGAEQPRRATSPQAQSRGRWPKGFRVCRGLSGALTVSATRGQECFWISWLPAQLCDPAQLFSSKGSSCLPCIHREASFLMAALSPGPTKGLQEEYNLHEEKDSDCCSCPEKWIGYLCSCYFISNEEKTWAESRNSCASQNSSLLQLKNRDELDFFKSNELFYWIGLSYNETRGAWVWEDGSALSQDLFLFQNLNPRNCVLYKPSNRILDEDCRNKNGFICKQRFI
ncbi:natural killer cells antigen CD94-like [Trichechus manatus latirostris]|uniref:Natural killer cells antigen CD94 n=1 Tax=Trichechus manatus latirostris TaxID=127582 RepID=A0A2Y9RMR6_TRIMA|nr:natural killer cells antigen CD94-like [Trichechus manatus latirostris]